MIHCPVTAHCQFYWNGNFMNTNCWWLKSLVTNKVKDIYFKIIHQIYTTNHFIKKYRNDLDESFTFCKTENQFCIFFFYDCINVLFFGLKLNNYFNYILVLKWTYKIDSIFRFYLENSDTKLHSP